jgi:hypothetical protein
MAWSVREPAGDIGRYAVDIGEIGDIITAGDGEEDEVNLSRIIGASVILVAVMVIGRCLEI